MVWLMCKMKAGNGFQTWHKDLANTDVVATIVVNLGSIEKKI